MMNGIPQWQPLLGRFPGQHQGWWIASSPHLRSIPEQGGRKGKKKKEERKGEVNVFKTYSIWLLTVQWVHNSDTRYTVYHWHSKWPHRVVHRPVRWLGLTEATVREIAGEECDILTRAGEKQLGAVDNNTIAIPVHTTTPATAFHLEWGKGRYREGDRDI